VLAHVSLAQDDRPPVAIVIPLRPFCAGWNACRTANTAADADESGRIGPDAGSSLAWA